MPRVAIIPIDFEESEEKRNGDGIPTIDVCIYCHKYFHEGDSFDENIRNANGVNQEYQEAETSSTNVEHPPYEECNYYCYVCGIPLVSKDN